MRHELAIRRRAEQPSGTVSNPDATLDGAFSGLTAITDIAPIEPGPLGGVTRCGTGQDKGVRVNVCAWADRHTVGMVTFIGFPKSDDPLEMFGRIRSQLEHPTPSQG
ncbi:hypothetical protein AB0C04_29170 [Micromonospora sp. NPDC048909]|uniref:hypothetical protein n=1 Tax=Micromonospora sp. NPDC048909 TaxID=3155643 RepID=UPI0033D0EE14